MNSRISEIAVTGVGPGVAHLFFSSGTSKIIPRPGVSIYNLGNGRFLVKKNLDVGGKMSFVLEIVDNVLTMVPN
jgi:hypothetical protein